MKKSIVILLGLLLIGEIGFIFYKLFTGNTEDEAIHEYIRRKEAQPSIPLVHLHPPRPPQKHLPFLANKGPEEITIELNQFFKEKPNLKFGTHAEIAPQYGFACRGKGCLEEQYYWREGKCFEGDRTTLSQSSKEVHPCWIMRQSDLNIVGVSAARRQQNGETYIYTLGNGSTLLFNWEPNDPEHGYLTVIEGDGTQKKFDPQGNRVN